MKNALIITVCLMATAGGFIYNVTNNLGNKLSAEREISISQLGEVGNGIYVIRDAVVVPATAPYVEYQDLDGAWHRLRVDGASTELKVLKQASFVEVIN